MLTSVFAILLLIIVITISMWIVLSSKYPLTSPINAISYLLYAKKNPHVSMSKQTIAFFPYWRVGDVQYTRFDLLSEISYFSLPVGSNGKFVQETGGKPDQGWQAWNSQAVKDAIAKAQISKDKVTLTITMLKNSDIDGLLNDTNAQLALIHNTLQQVSARKLNGVIVDFEYTGNPGVSKRDAFTRFASNFAFAVKQDDPNLTLSLTLPPLAVREKGLFDIPVIVGSFDRFIGMSYDYYSAGSANAGPVAPMNGFQTQYFFDVTTTYNDYLTYIPKDKIIMGIPYYGYDWAVEDGQVPLSQTLPPSDPNNYAAALSYGRMRQDSDLISTQCQWDDTASEEWCWYTDKNNAQHQVWFENNKSVQIKYIYAKSMDFNGIAIWALGYDSSYPDLWNIMEQTYKIH